MQEVTKKSKRGFALMDSEKQRAIAQKGWKSVPKEKRSFSQNAELAARAGRKDGDALASTAWRVAVGGHGDLLTVAAPLCASIGEQSHFERVMAPFIKARPPA